MTFQLIDVRDASYTYDADSEDALPAVRNLRFQVLEGEHLAILGRNGSGKSTLARLLNALLLPQTGRILVLGMDTQEEESIWEIRRNLGMVFQNPDNQIVGTTVEEDVAFGPENLGMPREEMLQVVPQSLRKVGLDGFEKRQPSELSGGQKQKLAVAGILAMAPKCIILDEATSMLDPRSRRELLRLVSELQKTQGLTLINVTHHMDEVLQADRVLVMSHGELVMQGTPNEVFFQSEKIQHLGLDVPSYIRVTRALASRLASEPTREQLATEDRAAEYLRSLLQNLSATPELSQTEVVPASSVSMADYQAAPIIEVEGLSHAYNVKRPDEIDAIHDISFRVWPGEFLGIAGHTGSGKSTLIQHLNGLLRPQEGTIRVLGYDVAENKDVQQLRRHVGMVFQYPEQQLFAETIYDDMAYGPKRLGLSDEEVRDNCLAALRLVGLGDIDLERSPFELSGGQMRRVAIAGILAMKPEVLILDEPAAGLDPQGREEIFATIRGLQREGVTIIFVSHSMDDLARLADRILILRNGRLQRIAPVAEIFSDRDFVLENDLEIPAVMRFVDRFSADYPSLDARVFTARASADRLIAAARATTHSEAVEESVQ